MCGGDGHTEAVKVDFDAQQLPYEGLLKVNAHDLHGSAVQYKLSSHECALHVQQQPKALTVLWHDKMRHGNASLISTVPSK